MAVSLLLRQRLLFAFVCFTWGVNWAAMKIGVTTVPPGFFSGTRWTVAGLVLIAWRLGNGLSWKVPLRLLPRLTLLAVMLISLNAVIMLYGLRYVSSGLASVISSALTPIGLLGFSILLGQERFNLRQAGAIALGVVGMLVLYGPKALSGHLGLAEFLGVIGIIVGNLSYCFGSVLSRPMMRMISPAQLAATTNLIGGAILLVLSIAFEPGVGAVITGNWGWPAWLGWLFMVLAGSLGATIIYFFLMRDWGASRTGSYAFISPVIAVATGVVLLDEHVDAVEAAGMVLMLAAAWLVLRRPAEPGAA